VAVGGRRDIYERRLLIDEYISKFYGQESQNINRIIEDMHEEELEFISDEEEDVATSRPRLRAPIISSVTPDHAAVEARASDITSSLCR